MFKNLPKFAFLSHETQAQLTGSKQAMPPPPAPGHALRRPHWGAAARLPVASQGSAPLVGFGELWRLMSSCLIELSEV